MSQLIKRNNQETIKAIHKHKGNLSLTSKALGVSRTTLYSYINNNPQIQDQLTIARDTRIDDLEDAALEQALGNPDKDIKPNPIMTMFLLKCLAKDRGYIDKYIEQPKQEEAPDLTNQDQIKQALDQYFENLKQATPITQQTNTTQTTDNQPKD